MTRHITLTGINTRHNTEFSKRKEVNLNHNFKIQIDESFKKTNIQNFVIDYQSLINQFNEIEKDASFVKKTIFIYYMLLVKHFTSLDNIPLDLNSMISACEKLIDLDILQEILNSFDENEIKKVKDAIVEFAENSELYKNQVGKLFSDVQLVQTDGAIVKEVEEA